MCDTKWTTNEVYMVKIKLIKGNYCLYYAESVNPFYKDFMLQANAMARPYLNEGWHLVFACVLDFAN